MEEVVKHINDTNASYRSINAGDAKNTDLFLDNEHYDMFKDNGNQITVRYHKDNLSQAILFIASILPRKFDGSAVHKKVNYTHDFVYEQLSIIDALFKDGDKPSDTFTQVWNLRKDVPQKKGGIDKRFYFNGLLKDISYQDKNGELKNAKFTIRNYLAGGYSDLHIIKDSNGIYDIHITNAIKPLDDGKEEDWHTPKMSLDKLAHHPFLLSALRTKPFMLLAGISGTGKSRNVRKLAQATVTEKLQREYDPEYKGENFEEDRWKLHKPANFEIIQVKPNWHNSMDVVGYLSNIPEPHYVFTPFVHFIVKAWQNPDVPFFLCLDEMNLAPVEEYFAEYLSAIESRGFENGEYETDPIIKPFKEFGEEKPSKDSKEPDKKSVCDCMLDALLPDFKASETNGAKAKLIDRLRNKGLTLPQNLIVIGTVNMDETTFSFSRKVLDRAMSIEMNEVDYEKFILGATDDDVKNLCSQIGTAELNRLLVDRHIEANEVLTELGGTMEGSDTLFVIHYLERINKLLEGTPFKLGYRASNEALIYLAAAKDFGCQSNSAAMDDFTLMKILSRIEGDESKLKLTDSAFDQGRLDAAGVNKDEAEKHGDLTLLTAIREIIKNHLGEYQETDAEEEEPQAETETQDSGAADDANKEEQTAKPALLRSIRKIDSMISQLERDHFVSYWN